MKKFAVDSDCPECGSIRCSGVPSKEGNVYYFRCPDCKHEFIKNREAIELQDKLKDCERLLQNVMALLIESHDKQAILITKIDTYFKKG